MEIKTFAELGLSAKVQQAITATGYTTPTPIQAAAIPVAMSGRDVLGIAQTGTGKTASFVLPMISKLETGRARARMPRSLILAPTRELAAQVAQSFEKYGVNHKLDLALLIGGTSMDEQTRKLDRGVDVLIATPGRLIDHFQRGRVMLMGVEILVIDEADRMLDMGFIPDIEKICKLLPPRRQTLFFSATMPAEITRLVHQFQNDPVRIEAAPPATTAKTITQKFCYCPTGEDWAKRDALRALLKGEGVRNAIIFCNRKVEVAILLKSLLKHGYNAGALHGDMDQKSRTETLDKFRSGEIAFLAASDVAARGLDIPDVSHVFNFDLPRDKDDYVHRIGRTGRAGKEGHSTSLVTPFDLKQLQEIEKMTGSPVEWTGEAPSEQDYADAGKRKRGGRPGAAGAGGGARPAAGAAGGHARPGAGAASGGGRQGGLRSSGRERPMPQRIGERGGPERPIGAGRSRGRSERADEQPVRREVLNTGQRVRPGPGVPPAPGLEAQPVISHGVRSPVQAPAQERSSGQPGGGLASQATAKSASQTASKPSADRSSLSRVRSRNTEGGGDRRPREVGARETAREPRQGGREPRREQQQQQQAPRNEGGGKPSGFADNVPAFLQKPVRPVKAVSE